MQIQCSGCGKAYSVAISLAGKTVRCKICGTTMRIEDNEGADAVSTLEQAAAMERSATLTDVPPIVPPYSSAAQPLASDGAGPNVRLYAFIGGGVFLAIVVIVLVVLATSDKTRPARMDVAGTNRDTSPHAATRDDAAGALHTPVTVRPPEAAWQVTPDPAARPFLRITAQPRPPVKGGKACAAAEGGTFGVMSGATASEVRVVNLETGAIVRTVRCAMPAAVNRDGSLIVSDGQVLASETGQKIATLQQYSRDRAGHEFFCGDDLFVSAGEAGRRSYLAAHDVRTGVQRWRLDLGSTDWQQGTYVGRMHAAASPSGKYIARVQYVVEGDLARGGKGHSQLWLHEARDGRRIGDLRLSSNCIDLLGVTFSPDGQELAILSQTIAGGRWLHVHDATTGRMMLEHYFGPAAWGPVRSLPNQWGWIIGRLVVKRDGMTTVAVLPKGVVAVAVGAGGEVVTVPDLNLVRIPLDRIDQACRDLSRAEAYVKPGQPVSLKIEVKATVVDTPEQAKAVLEKAFTERLRTVGIPVSAGQPTTLVIEYRELSALREPQTHPAVIEAKWDSGDGAALWSGKLNTIVFEATPRTATPEKRRDSVIEDLMQWQMPTHLFKESTLPALPLVLEVESQGQPVRP